MYLYIKRILDLLFAILIGIIFLPFALILALCIKMDSKGPVFFRQLRVGKNCKIFKIYKFRSMRMKTESEGNGLSDMERTTRMGKIIRKLSLDELPQVLNIIKGEMSFIGPRPLLVEYIPRYTSFQIRRHEVLPGITGWAQVNGRNTISWEKKFQYDVWYVDHISWKLDLKIIWMTCKKVLLRKDVNQGKEETMPIFYGNVNQEEGKQGK